MLSHDRVETIPRINRREEFLLEKVRYEERFVSRRTWLYRKINNSDRKLHREEGIKRFSEEIVELGEIGWWKNRKFRAEQTNRP